MEAFLGINYIMGINKLSSIAEYWRVDEYIGNEGIRNDMIHQRFVDILQKQYIKSKPTKWVFKAWMRCASKTCYAYIFNNIFENSYLEFLKNT